MTITLGWWIAPVLVTLMCIAFPMLVERNSKPTGGYDIGGGVILALVVLVCIIVALIAWLIWALFA